MGLDACGMVGSIASKVGGRVGGWMAVSTFVAEIPRILCIRISTSLKYRVEQLACDDKSFVHTTRAMISTLRHSCGVVGREKCANLTLLHLAHSSSSLRCRGGRFLRLFFSEADPLQSLCLTAVPGLPRWRVQSSSLWIEGYGYVGENLRWGGRCGAALCYSSW